MGRAYIHLGCLVASAFYGVNTSPVQCGVAGTPPTPKAWPQLSAAILFEMSGYSGALCLKQRGSARLENSQECKIRLLKS